MNTMILFIYKYIHIKYGIGFNDIYNWLISVLVQLYFIDITFLYETCTHTILN